MTASLRTWFQCPCRWRSFGRTQMGGYRRTSTLTQKHVTSHEAAHGINWFARAASSDSFDLEALLARRARQRLRPFDPCPSKINATGILGKRSV
eukprot:5332443-Pyramimonas_sp.AAC.1